METIVERPGALDVHKAQVTACVRVPVAGGAREQHVAEFPTTVAGTAAADGRPEAREDRERRDERQWQRWARRDEKRKGRANAGGRGAEQASGQSNMTGHHVVTGLAWRA